MLLNTGWHWLTWRRGWRRRRRILEEHFLKNIFNNKQISEKIFRIAIDERQKKLQFRNQINTIFGSNIKNIPHLTRLHFISREKMHLKLANSKVIPFICIFSLLIWASQFWKSMEEVEDTKIVKDKDMQKAYISTNQIFASEKLCPKTHKTITLLNVKRLI